MKKLIMLTCLLAAGLALGACSSSSQTTESEETASQQGLEEGDEATDDESNEGAESAESSDDEAQASADAETASSGPNEWCLASVEGINAQAKKGDGDVVLVLSAEGNTDEVRARAQKMVEHHNQMHGHDGTKVKTGKGMGRGQGKGMKRGRKGHGLMAMAKATYEETDNGAMVHFAPAKAEHMTGLEEQVREHADWISEGSCPRANASKAKAEPEANDQGDERADEDEGDSAE